MCSWCWGFAPEIQTLAKEFSVEVVVGGLRPGPSAEELGDRMAEFLRSHWVEIAERTGQPFDTEFLKRRDGWVYDTEPAAIAVALLRESQPPSTLDYFTDIQHAFYAEGRDITDYDELTDIAAPHGADVDRFRADLDTPEAKKRAWADFSRARNWGISGFPALIAELDDERLALLAKGWTRAELIQTRITSLRAEATG